MLVHQKCEFNYTSFPQYLACAVAILYWSESLEQEQERRVNIREKRRTSRSRGAYRSIVRVW